MNGSSVSATLSSLSGTAPPPPEAAAGIGADLLLDLGHLFLEALVEQLRRRPAAVGKARAEAELLPDLGAADLGERGVLDDVVDRHRAAAAEPAFEICHGRADVVAEAAGCPDAVVHFEEVVLRGRDVVAADAELVGPGMKRSNASRATGSGRGGSPRCRHAPPSPRVPCRP